MGTDSGKSISLATWKMILFHIGYAFLVINGPVHPFSTLTSFAAIMYVSELLSWHTFASSGIGGVNFLTQICVIQESEESIFGDNFDPPEGGTCVIS